MSGAQGHDGATPLLPPYAALLGVVIEAPASGALGPLLAMPYAPQLEGRPGLLHGGSTAGLIDMAAQAALLSAKRRDGSPLTGKPIGITIDYTRPGRQQTTYARGRVTRVGSRVATIIVEAWQTSEAESIAAARRHVLSTPASAAVPSA